MDNNKGLNILLCQALLTMRRHEGILKTVGLERALLFRFLHEQKMKALGRVITVNLVYATCDEVANIPPIKIDKPRKMC